MTDEKGPIVWIAGVGWDDLTGTDKRIVLELGRLTDVLWVDSPRRGGWLKWGSDRRSGEEVAPGVRRLRIPGLPGFSRAPIRAFTRATADFAIRRALGTTTRAQAIILANPIAHFPTRVDGTRVFYVTDDWIAGADLMSYSRGSIKRAVTHNLGTADLLAAVTPRLVKRMQALGGSTVKPPAILLPNGAPEVLVPNEMTRLPIAGVVGQLNERLDLTVLEAVVESGIALRLIGPRTEREPEFGRRLDLLIANEAVQWTGRVPCGELGAHLGTLAVGLTPYADNDFNRASFPLKTLEYLAAGVPVVSTDLPASRWIDSEDVEIPSSLADFTAAVLRRVESVSDPESARVTAGQCRALARHHRWERRADQLLNAIDFKNTKH